MASIPVTHFAACQLPLSVHPMCCAARQRMLPPLACLPCLTPSCLVALSPPTCRRGAPLLPVPHRGPQAVPAHGGVQCEYQGRAAIYDTPPAAGPVSSAGGPGGEGGGSRGHHEGSCSAPAVTQQSLGSNSYAEDWACWQTGISRAVVCVAAAAAACVTDTNSTP